MVAENILIFINSRANEHSGGNIQNGPVASWVSQGKGIKTSPFLTYNCRIYKKIQLEKGDVWAVGIQNSIFCFVCDMKVQCKSWTDTILTTHPQQEIFILKLIYYNSMIHRWSL